ncbi:hypothetical protein LSUE1_G009511, partial [Lachnellula suecica]
MAGRTYDLGMLVNNSWSQHANSAGQVYYVDIATRQSQLNIPAGWEDAPTDIWNIDNSVTWPQWYLNSLALLTILSDFCRRRNQRTGRAVLLDPNPPPPRNYLEVTNVATHLRLVERVPDSPEALYRRPMMGILRFLFPDSQGFDVLQEEVVPIDGKPDFVIFKISCRPGGSTYAYEFCIVESKRMGKPWGSTEDQCREYCTNHADPNYAAYAIVHIGLEIRFYKYSGG